MGGQARAALATGTPLDVFVANEHREGSYEGIRYVRYTSPLVRLGRVSRFMKARLLSSVPALEGYDVVFVRYPTAVDLDPLHFLRSTSARVATIHHALEVREQLTEPLSVGTLGRAGLEWFQGRRVLRHVDGIVGVTDEIRDFQVARSGSSVPAMTFANGVDVASVATTGFCKADDELRLVLVASANAPWHGLDRLRRSLMAYRGKRKVHLDVVGSGFGAPGTTTPTGSGSLCIHGSLAGTALDEVLARATIGVSTLSLHLKGIEQAAVLKTREYIARGLPVLLGYDDVDVPADWPYAHRVPNDDSLVSIEALVEFADRVSSNAGTAEKMRRFAEATLDWRNKVPALARFAERIAQHPKEHT